MQIILVALLALLVFVLGVVIVAAYEVDAERRHPSDGEPLRPRKSEQDDADLDR